MSVFSLKFYGQLSNIILSRLASTNKAGLGGIISTNTWSDREINQRGPGIYNFADVATTGLETEPGPVLVMFAK